MSARVEEKVVDPVVNDANADTGDNAISTVETAKPEVAKEDAPRAAVKQKKDKKVPILDVVLSIKHLSIMLKSSMAIEDTLKALVEQTANKNLKVVWLDVLTQLQGGKSLSESMEEHSRVFSHIIVSIIRAGEEGGTLEKNLSYLADYIKKDYELKKKVKSALFYPAFILCFTSFELIAFIFMIIPRLEPFFKSVKEVPAFTQMILTGSEFVRGNVIAIVAVLILGFLGMRFYFRTKPGIKSKDKIMLGLPIIKHLVINTILANFSRTLGILLESGIPITKALSICSETVGNHIYTNAIGDLKEKVKSGENLADSLAKHASLFPPTFSKLISVGEETGTLEANLLYLHEFYADEVNDMSSNLTTLLEPILLVFIGGMIGILAIALVVPIFQVTSSIG